MWKTERQNLYLEFMITTWLKEFSSVNYFDLLS